MNWQFELETSGAYTLRVTVLDKVSAADIDILDVLAADDKLGSAKLDLGELKNTDAYEDKPLELKTALRPFDPHRADVRGAGIALLLYARGPLVAHLLQDLLSGLRWGILSHLAPEMVQGEGGCEVPGAVLAPFAGLNVLRIINETTAAAIAYQRTCGTCLVSHPRIVVSAISSLHGSGACLMSLTRQRSTIL